ncbi:serine/threonine protein kinase [Cellvibrio sp. KY-GH-1]|uniref:serine/threonine protein kinase n=1 Tax=Cellvibrio sp. KY-GH-1 TaxID=2303332 RepID=UPI0012474E27|nr:serine/threonine-protein kinase [Cellvibrio sp. KY-GH-1]QEY16733.1 serine/threonine protein kinase [Cellvibrio sp. KY-GH-1]
MDASTINPSPLLKATNSESVVIPASALPIGEALKEYVINGIIGEGGFGIVYAAQDTLLHRNVAIKEYMPAAIANRLSSAQINLRSVRHQQTFDAGMQGFIEEARLLAQFKHPALVEILRFWEANGTAYMVMPHYSGKTLRNLLRLDRNFASEAWLKSILAPILDATELLHNNSIYHRDIAPDNIVIQDNGQPVLLDLGSARRVIAGMQSALTVVVKPGYAPIEQYTEDTANEQGPWTDIYALGAVLYFSITGSAPSASVSRMMRDSLKLLTPQDHPQFSDGFLAAINRALQLRPMDRFQTISEFRDALNLSTVHTANLSYVSQLIKSVATVDTHDDEITQILTEEEINQFKEKLLITLGSPQKTQQLQSPIPTVEQPLQNQFNENILLNSSNAETKPISSFNDVKQLLEQKPVSVPPKTKENAHPPLGAKHNAVSQTSAQANASATGKLNTKNRTTTIFAIGGAALVAGLFAGGYLFSKDNTEIKPLHVNNSTAAAAPIAAETQIALTSADQNANQISTNISDGAASPSLPATSDLSNASDQTSQSISDLIPPEQGAVTAEFSTAPLADSAQILPSEIGVQNQTNEVTTFEPTTATSTNAASNKKPKPDAPAETARPVAFGTAKLTLLPWGEIWVDEQRYGVSPPVRELSLAPGTYRIELRNPGLPTEIRTLSIKQGENPAIYHNFAVPQQQQQQQPVTAAKPVKTTQAKPQTSAAQPAADSPPAVQSQGEPVATQTAPVITSERTLNIKVQPWGEIFIDGKMAGVIPPLRQLKIAPGEHKLEIRHPSYATKSITISATDSLSQTIEHQFK